MPRDYHLCLFWIRCIFKTERVFVFISGHHVLHSEVSLGRFRRWSDEDHRHGIERDSVRRKREDSQEGDTSRLSDTTQEGESHLM